MCAPPLLFLTHFCDLKQRSVVGERLVLHLNADVEHELKIDNYEDFQKSGCEMLVLLYDACYLEIYCKDQQLIQQIYNLAFDIQDTIIEKKYDSNDTRTTMYV